jgi:hypothetical protein
LYSRTSAGISVIPHDDMRLVADALVIFWTACGIKVAWTGT